MCEWLGKSRLWRRLADRDERGGTAILTLVFFAFTFVIGLIAVNAGVMFAGRVSARRAADAAALAACQELPNAASADTFARQYGASSGGLNATGASDLESGRGNQTAATTVDSSGAVSQRTGQPLQNDRVRVNIARTQGLIGVPEMGFTDRAIGAYAVCRRDEGSLAVLQALADGAGTLVINGSDVQLPRGGIVANSTDPTGLRVLGNGTVDAKYVETGSGTAQTTGSSSIEPSPSTGTTPDPYAGVPEPALPAVGNVNAPQNKPGCNYGSAGQTTPRNPAMCTISGGTAEPGVYWGGLTLQGNVSLAPGVYHLAGGGLIVDVDAVVSGTGVTFFNGRNPYGQNAPRQRCGAVHIQDNARLLITPPSAGDLRELIIFQSRTPPTNGDPANIACDADLQTEAGVQIGLPDGPYGAIYYPNARVNLGPQSLGQGGEQLSINVIVVADRIDVTGPVHFADLFIPSGDVRHGDIHLVE